MISSIRSFLGGRATARALVITAALLAVACDDDDPIDPGPSHSWAVALAGAGDYAGITADVVVTANSVSFDGDIELAGAEPDSVFTWGIFEGACDDLGNRVGAASLYSEIEADATGAGSDNARGTGGMTSGEDYVAQLLTEVDAADVVVACGALVEED